MIDYELKDGDLRIVNGDFAVVDGGLGTRQRLEQKLRLWRGEWFFNVRAGFPWLQDVLGKRPRATVLQSLFRRTIQDDPGVRRVERLELSYEDVERRVRVEFDALLESGTVETIEVTL